VVAVCHAGVIVASLRALLGIPHPGTGARLLPTNTGLTELGRAQAAALGDYLQAHARITADAQLASTLPRAVETAQLIAPALGFDAVEQHCDLCEVHTGEADGLEWAEYGTRYGSFLMDAEPDRVFAPEGESWNTFHERVESMLERVAREYEGQTVVAVCHAGVIMASLRTLLGMPRSGVHGGLRPSNTGLTEWEHDETTRLWTLHSFNETPHLIPTVSA
jgi:probable phosphoglycerate mutase